MINFRSKNLLICCLQVFNSNTKIILVEKILKKIKTLKIKN